MKNIKEIKVFISSPSDFKSERQDIKKFVDGYKSDKYILCPVLWEEKLPTTSHITPQKLINEELLKSSDLLIGVFSSKFGSPTEEYASGTVEEIEIFISSGKPVILYFITDKDNRKPSELTIEELESLKKIQQFKDKYSSNSIYKEIELKSLKEQLENDLSFNIRKLDSQNDIIIDNTSISKQTNIEPEESTANVYSGNWWADENITKMINDFIESKGLGAKYRGDLTFYENTQMIKDSGNFTESTNKTILEKAKAEAFNKKYGNFNYDEDLRDRFPNWSDNIRRKIRELLSTENINSVLGVGSNYGKEINDIFTNEFNATYTVLDISKDAIERGKKIYTNIKFIESDMEVTYPIKEKFDICLCLRTIQSRGAFRQNVIIQMDKALKKRWRFTDIYSERIY